MAGVLEWKNAGSQGKTRLGRQGVMSKTSMDLCLGIDEEPAESLWVRVKGSSGQVRLSWGFATGCLARKTQRMRASLHREE